MSADTVCEALGLEGIAGAVCAVLSREGIADVADEARDRETADAISNIVALLDLRYHSNLAHRGMRAKAVICTCDW